MDDRYVYITDENGKVLPVSLDELSANDGLELTDFLEWFRYTPTPESPMAIIHFTAFRYYK